MVQQSMLFCFFHQFLPSYLNVNFNLNSFNLESRQDRLIYYNLNAPHNLDVK
jgi:hypothetical protein